MFMILAAPADTDNPTLLLAFLAIMGVAAFIYGVRWAFNLRGAVDSMMQRRRAVREWKAQQSGDLTFVGIDAVGPWFFRIVGSVVALASLLMVAVSLILIS
ncbi:hypothetical protein ACFCX0_03280 [Streptomyces sp. NPDC056352]|uniref:hypothetical protein n=1 Tax=Streptomyces sp. NPDC056352 TaxID=3345791 RepID=UPI0035D8A430